MRIGDFLKEISYTAIVLLMIVGLWVFAYSRSMNAQVSRHWWPPQDPVLARKVLEDNPDTAVDEAKQPLSRVTPPATSVSVVDVNDGD